MTLVLPATSLSISPNFHFIERGLIVTGQPTVEEWGQTLETIQIFDEDMLPYIIGDMLNYGELTYNQADSQFLKYNGEGRYTRNSLRNLKYVCSRWPVSRRRYELPFSFYQETAGLSPEQQDRIMQKIVDSGGRRNGLREEVRQVNNGKERNPPVRIEDRLQETEEELQSERQRADNAEAELAEYKSMQSAQPAISFTFADPPNEDRNSYVVKAIRQIKYYLSEDDSGLQYSGVTIYADGRVMWIP